MIITNYDKSSSELYKLITNIINNNYLNNRLFITNNAIDYDDLIQQGMLYALEAKQTYDPGQTAAFTTWITTQVDRRLLNYLKENNGTVTSGRHRADKGVLPYTLDIDNPDITLPSIQYELDTDELYSLLIRKCNELLKPPNNFLVLYYFGVLSDTPLTYDDLAGMYNFNSRQAVQQRIERSIDKLKGDSELSNYSELLFINDKRSTQKS